MKIIFILLYFLFTTLGVLGIKLGGDSLIFSLKNGFILKMSLLTLAGFLCYFVSFALWQKLLVSFDLSYIVPVTTGIMQIVVFIIGIFIFKETSNLYSFLGVCLIIVGIFLLSMKNM